MTEKVHVLHFRSTDPPVGESDLEQRARQIGALAGRVVALVRQAQEKLNDEESWNDLRTSAATRAQGWQRRAGSGYQQVRERARQAARDYPVHVALAAGVAGFVVGAALRIRRTHRAH
jgi:hypothetical protein